MALPSHVKGWSIPGIESRPPLAVIQVASWGWHLEAGVMNDGMTGLDTKQAYAWAVEAESRPGIAFLSFETSGEWDTQYRSTAALLHFCVEAQGLGGGDRIFVPRYIAERLDPGRMIVLENLGFAALDQDDDLVGRPDRIYDFTSGRFPEFTQAQALPQPQPTPAA